MASAYALARTYNQFIPPVNLELMAQALSVKQQRYDQGYAQVESTIDFMKNIDIVKGEDAQYFRERVDKLTNELNSLEGVDFSSKGVTKAIKTYVGQAIDDNVINAITSTKKFRNYQSEVAKIQEKNDGRYSTINEMYGLRPFMNYLNDGKVGSKLGDLRYSPKVDVNEKMTKITKEAFEKYGVREDFQISSDNWSKVITKFGGIEGEKIRSFVEANLSAEDRQQLAIDGWYNNGMAEGEKAQNILSEHITKKNEEYEGQKIILQESLKKGGKTEAEINQIKQQIAAYEKAKDYYKELPKNLQSPEQIGAYFEKEKLIGGLQEMYGKFLKSREMTVNDVYAAKMKHFLDVDKFNLNKDEFQFQKDKFAIEREDKLIEQQQKLKGSITYSPTLNKENNLEDIYGEGLGKVMKAEIEVKNAIDERFNALLPPGTESALDAAFKAYKSDGKITEEEKLEWIKLNSTDEASRNAYGQLQINYLKVKDTHTKMMKEFEPIVDSDFKEYKSIYSEGQSFIGLMAQYKKMYDRANGEEKKNYEILYNIAQDRYKNLKIDKNNPNEVNTAYMYKNVPIDKAVIVKGYELKLSKEQQDKINEIQKTIETDIWGFGNTFGINEDAVAESKRKQKEGAEKVEQINKIKDFGANARQEKLRDISLSLTEEYGKKNIVISPDSPLYNEAFSVFGLIEQSDVFDKKQEIVLKPLGNNKFEAFQKYRDKKGVIVPTRSIEIDVNEVMKLAPNLANNIDFGQTIKPKFIETKQPLSWTYQDSDNPYLNKQVVTNNIDNILKNDTDFATRLKQIVNNPSRYSMVTERNASNRPTIGLYEGDALIYQLKTSHLTEEEMAGTLEGYIVNPELFIVSTVSEILSRKVKPPYFQNQ